MHNNTLILGYDEDKLLKLENIPSVTLLLRSKLQNGF